MLGVWWTIGCDLVSERRRESGKYHERQVRAAHALLTNPRASNVARHGARCRLNRSVVVLRRLASIPRMKRRLESDRLREKGRW